MHPDALRSPLSALLLVSFASLTIVAEANARDRIYRVFSLGVIGTDLAELGIALPSPSSGTRLGFNTLGINDSGVVVGGFRISEDVVHAFYWLPDGGPAPWIDLHEEAFGEEDEETSFANAVNDQGMVVGQYGANLFTSCSAYGWLTDPSVVALDLHSTAGLLSVAYDISHGSTAAIVGETTLVCPLDPSIEYSRPFLLEGFDGSTPVPGMQVLPVGATRTTGFAAAVVPDGASVDGFGGELGEQAEGDPCAYSPPIDNCLNPGIDAFFWLDDVTADERLDPLFIDPEPKTGALALDVNSERDAVGIGWRSIGPVELGLCESISLLWPSAVANEDPFALGDMMPTGQAGDQSRAEGIGERDGDGCARVVGWNTDAGRGLLWYGDPEGSSFCPSDLNELVLPCDFEQSSFIIVQAHEINSNGHIAVILQETTAGGPYYHAGVLTCPADLNGDLRVDGADLGLVLATQCGYSPFSACTASNLRLADINCDGVVDGADLGLLLAAWTDTELCSIAPPCACNAEQSSFATPAPVDPLSAIEAAAAMLGFESMAAFAIWATGVSPEQAVGTATSIVVLAKSLDL